METERLLTQAELDKLKAELKELRTSGRIDIADKLKTAKSYGDLSENSEYDEAKNDQAKMEARIQELEYIVSQAKVIDEASLSTEMVRTGLSVRIYDKTYDEEVIYHIVGSQADPSQNRISDECPVGKELLGHRVGDVVVVETPVGNDTMEILEIFKALSEE